MELCRVRAVPDPVYALPVVVCPRCADASVRRRHPTAEGWRTFIRLRVAWGLFALRLLLLVVFTLLFCAFLHELRMDLNRSWPALRAALESSEAGTGIRRVLARTGLMWSLIGWACYSTGLGAWLVAGFGHWRWWAVIAAWAAAMLGIVLAAWGLNLAEHWLDAWVRHRPWSNQRAYASRYMTTFAMALASLPLAVPGAVIGLGLRALARGASRRSFRKRLARQRRRRNG